eukprot:3586630-Pleurochrysis_carterae.AAC.2
MFCVYETPLSPTPPLPSLFATARVTSPKQLLVLGVRQIGGCYLWRRHHFEALLASCLRDACLPRPFACTLQQTIGCFCALLF